MSKKEKMVMIFVWVVVVLGLICFVLSQNNNNILGKELTYWKGVKEYEDGSLYLAASEFIEIKDHRNSKGFIYNIATEYYEQGDFENAEKYYNEIKDYKDAKNRANNSHYRVWEEESKKAREEMEQKELEEKQREEQRAKRETEIRNSKPFIGMTREELEICAWGKPRDINKTTTQYGVSEQWCYDGYKYVYLDDGVVTTIQE